MKEPTRFRVESSAAPTQRERSSKIIAHLVESRVPGWLLPLQSQGARLLLACGGFTEILAEVFERISEFLLKFLRILALLEPLNHLLHRFRHLLPGRLRHLAHQPAKLARVGIVLAH